MAAEESTTPGLVERIRVILEAGTRNDWDTVLSFYALDAVWDSPGIGMFEGHAALRGLWEDFAGVYRDWRVDLEEGRTFGNGVVLAVVNVTGRPAGSGKEVRERSVWVYDWVDGLIVRVVDCRDIDEAHRCSRTPRPRARR